MRRADRLFQIVTLVRGRRLTTAKWLAERLEVSERTVYRDVADLVASGVAIEGEAGVGYRVARGFELPPLSFSTDELEALVAGARMVRAWGGHDLGQAAASALTKIDAVLPADRRGAKAHSAFYAPDLLREFSVGLALDRLRAAIHQRRVVRFGYVRVDGEPSQRSVRPLGLFFWGQRWTLCAWCEARLDFRNFRVDRISDLAPLDRYFEETTETSLATYLERMGAQIDFLRVP
jgi:predicted DNA-binding transcriptional regulator YafY